MCRQFLHFIRFESSKTREAIEFIANTGINQSLRTLPCTGGGAHKVNACAIAAPPCHSRTDGECAWLVTL